MSEPEMVERKARIFRFGHYPRKGKGADDALGWGITRDEFIAANGETGTIPVGFDPINRKHYEGKKSALDSRTGTATFAVEGDEVHAVVRLPKWLDEVRGEIDLKISSVIGRVGKELRKIDLVDTPHIPDAVFFADDHGNVLVFTDDEPEEGPAAKAEAEAEAVVFEDEGRRELAQMHHEITAGCMPGLCSGDHGTANETDAEHSLRVIHDHSVHEGGAYCPGMDHHGEVGMSDVTQNEEVAAEDAVGFTEDSPLYKSMRAELDRLSGQIADKDAVQFADSVTRGDNRRAYPVERASIVDGYKRAASLDSKLGDTVTFTAEDGKTARQGSHLDAFKAAVLVRPRITTKPGDTVGFDLGFEPVADPRVAELETIDKEARAYGSRANGVKK
jgi:hypothetical protein